MSQTATDTDDQVVREFVALNGDTLLASVDAGATDPTLIDGCAGGSWIRGEGVELRGWA